MDWAGIGSFASGLIGNVWDYIANSETNSTNQYIAQETNWLNQQNFYDSLEWAKQQYEQEKAENRFLVDQAYQRELENREHNEWYNSPEQMMERYRQAGINPYLAMVNGSSLGHVSSGNIGAQVGQNPHLNMPQSHPAVTGAPMQAFQGFGIGMNQAMSLVNQMREVDIKQQIADSDIASNQMKNFTTLADTLSRLKERDVNNKYIDRLSQKIGAELLFDRDTYRQRVNQQKWSTALTMYEALNEQVQVSLSQQAYEMNIDTNNRAWMQLKGYLSSIASQNALNKVLGEKTYQELVGVSWDNARKEFENNPQRLQQIYKENREYWNDLLARMRFDRTYQGFQRFWDNLTQIIPFAPGSRSLQNLPITP